MANVLTKIADGPTLDRGRTLIPDESRHSFISFSIAVGVP
jgi:hypothetical protein